MNSRFIARPPSSVKWRAIPKHFVRLCQSAWYILWQTLTPFKSRPDEIESFPEPGPGTSVTESQVKQCQCIFDQAEARRLSLEQKAQSTFGLMVFLVPLLASVFAFSITRGVASKTLLLTSVFTGVSAIFLLLGFISAARAVAVKTGETLFLHSVIHEDGRFRKYSEAFHARGLLYCASMNSAINDHIAQFVKGAHILTAAAVVAMLIAAVPGVMALATVPTSPTQTRIVGPVSVSSPDLLSLRNDVATLRADIQKLSSTKATEEELKRLDDKLLRLDEKMEKLQKAKPGIPRKEVKSR